MSQVLESIRVLDDVSLLTAFSHVCFTFTYKGNSLHLHRKKGRKETKYTPPSFFTVSKMSKFSNFVRSKSIVKIQKKCLSIFN